MTGAKSDKTHTIVFQPSGARGQVATGTSLRTAATQLGVEIESLCADTATCGKCRVLIETGRRGGVESSLAHASPMGATEALWITKREKTWRRIGLDPERLRLSCQAHIQGDMVVFVPESSRGNRQIVRKAATDRAIEIRPSIRRYYLELTPATLEKPSADVERLTEALVEAMSRINADPTWADPVPEELGVGLSVLRNIGAAIRDGDWKVSVTVWQDREIIDVQPGYAEEMYGAAIDIGSTALAVYICDLHSGEIVASESMMNPQTAVGDDIMTRMTYEIDNEEGLATLNEGVIEALNRLLERALRAARLRSEVLYELVVVGNTTMHHLFLGIPTRNLGTIPFVPTLHRPLDVKARDVGVVANQGANLHLLPIAASFVGADTMGVLLAEEPHKQDENVLIIDVGTNAELVLGNRNTLLCTSTPMGPAFEGAHIEYGMRAAHGAIERIEIDAATLEARYKVIGFDGWRPADGELSDVKGICGSAIIDGIAEMFRVGIIGPRGHFDETRESPRIRRGDLGWEYVVAWESDTSIGRDIPITIEDVRQIQLAKAALYAASRILLREFGIDAPDRIILAGAFGSHIDREKALILGMIPHCPPECVFSVGNAAGDGARIALLNRHKRAEAEKIATEIRRIELPVAPDFQTEYLLATGFPHMAHPFPSISHLIPHYEPDPMAARLMRADEGTAS